MKSYPSAEGVDLLLEIVGLITSAQRHTSPTDGSNDLRKQTQCRGANKENYICQLFHQSRSIMVWRCPCWGSAFFRYRMPKNANEASTKRYVRAIV